MTTPAVQNFYLHVNERWLNDPVNAIPEEYGSWGGFVQLADQNQNDQIAMIDELSAQNFDDLDADQKKIVSIWHASNRRFEMWDSGKYDIEPIRDQFHILECLLNKDQVSDPSTYAGNLAKYFYHTQIDGLDNLMNIDRGSSPLNSDHVMMDIAPSGLSLPSREYYIDDLHKDLRVQYIDHLNDVVDIMRTMGIELNDRFAQNVIEFEKKIAHIRMKKEHARRHDEYLTIIPLEGMYDRLDGLKYLPEKKEQYNEEELKVCLSPEHLNMVKIFMETVYCEFGLRDILRANYAWSFIESNANQWNQMVAYDGDYFQRIFQIMFDPLNHEQLIDYYRYHIIRSLHGFVDMKLNQLMFDFYGKKINGQQKQKSRDKRSVQAVNGYAGELMGKLYVRKYFSESSKRDIEQMIDRVIDVMNHSLEHNDWLTPSTKQNAIRKLQRFVKKIGYPDRWKDMNDLNVRNGADLYEWMRAYQRWEYTHSFCNKVNSVLDRSEWLMTPQTVNAYFMPPQNEIVFPAAILQPPFYYKQTSDLPDLGFDVKEEIRIIVEMKRDPMEMIMAANYGGIGAVIAHEITHGYDDQGSKYDMDGNLNNWWMDMDRKMFERRIEAMVRQSDAYQYMDPDSGTIVRMNSRLTLGENLADLGGLTLSLRAMYREFDQDDEHDPRFRDTMTRVFFKSYANIWKQNIRKEALINRLINDPHAPSDFRGNAVKNIDAFHRVFGTTPSDAMWLDPLDRVILW